MIQSEIASDRLWNKKSHQRSSAIENLEPRIVLNGDHQIYGPLPALGPFEQFNVSKFPGSGFDVWPQSLAGFSLGSFGEIGRDSVESRGPTLVRNMSQASNLQIGSPAQLTGGQVTVGPEFFHPNSDWPDSHGGMSANNPSPEIRCPAIDVPDYDLFPTCTCISTVDENGVVTYECTWVINVWPGFDGQDVYSQVPNETFVDVFVSTGQQSVDFKVTKGSVPLAGTSAFSLIIGPSWPDPYDIVRIQPTNEHGMGLLRSNALIRFNVIPSMPLSPTIGQKFLNVELERSSENLLSGNIDFSALISRNDFSNLRIDNAALSIESSTLEVSSDGQISGLGTVANGVYEGSLSIFTSSGGHFFNDGPPSGSLALYEEQRAFGRVEMRLEPMANGHWQIVPDGITQHTLGSHDLRPGLSNSRGVKRLTPMTTVMPMFQDRPYWRYSISEFSTPARNLHTYLSNPLSVLKPFDHYFNFEIPVSVTIGNLSENTPPIFVSEPKVDAQVGELYVYDAHAIDMENDSINYNLVSGPPGIALNTQSGRITWEPTLAQVGLHQFVIKAIDEHDAFSLQSFTVSVSPSGNTAPEFTSKPLVTATVGTPYRYVSTASDSDGDSMMFSKGQVEWPDGFEPANSQDLQFQFVNNGLEQYGVFSWEPPVELAGRTVRVEEVVTDGFHSPIRRHFEIAIQGVVGNHPPMITSDPKQHYQTPLTPNPGSSLDPVQPDSLVLHLADGQQTTVQANFDPTQLGASKADIVFVVDITGSMHDAVQWMSEPSIPNEDPLANSLSMVELLENRLSELGVTDIRFGLAVFRNAADTQLDTMPIAVGNYLNPGVSNPGDPPTSSDELWGNSEQLREALLQFWAPVSGGEEAGYDAILRVLNENPGEQLVEDPNNPGVLVSVPRAKYDFRGDATSALVLVSDDEVYPYHFSYEVQQDLLATMVGDTSTTTDDVIFVSVIGTTLTAHDSRGNLSNDILGYSGQTPISLVNYTGDFSVESHSIRFDPRVSSSPIGRIHSEPLFRDPKLSLLEFSPGLKDWSLHAQVKILDIDDEQNSFDQKLRVYLRNNTDSGTVFGNDFFYLEVDARTDIWTIRHSLDNDYLGALTKHPNVHQWPDIKADVPFEIEVRVLHYPAGNGSDRVDLFVDGEPIATGSFVAEGESFSSRFAYPEHYFWSSWTGFESHNSAFEVDWWRVGQYSPWHRLTYSQGLPVATNEATKYRYTNGIPDSVARQILLVDYGTLEGTSYSPDIIGVDPLGRAYKLDTSTSVADYSIEVNGQVMSALRHQVAHYVSFSEATSGSVWSLGLLRGGLNNIENRIAFSNAFSDSLASQILARSISLVSDNPQVVDVQPRLDLSLPVQWISYDVTIEGDGGSSFFELEFVRNEPTGRIPVGTIPVWISGPYSHDFEVFDAEHDVPFRFSFDPKFVDQFGSVITHGARLVNSGRDSMVGDRLIWDPPQLTYAEDYQFRVLVYDSAGQVGRKDWTVTVEPHSLLNTLPEIDISELALLGGIPVLPEAKELRNYRYPVLATDQDVPDRESLRYYLVDTRDSNGNLLSSVPEWLDIDRNTGVLRGRPGSSQLGSHWITVEVRDGRFYLDENEQVMPSLTRQTFHLSVAPRDSINHRPTIVEIGSMSVRAGQSVTVHPVAYDQDGDDITFSLASSPQGMNINASSGRIDWTPSVEQIGIEHAVVVSVSDGLTSSQRSFRLVVGGPNRPPEITAELPEWVTYADYQQTLSTFDPDGDQVFMQVAVGLPGMITRFEGGEFKLIWPAQDIRPGLHKIRLRAFDFAGGITERDYYVHFRLPPANGAFSPVIESIRQPTWREGSFGVAWIDILSHRELAYSELAQISFDRQAGLQGLDIDYSMFNVEFIVTSGEEPFAEGYYRYSLPAKWIPQYQGTFQFQLTAGASKKRLNFEVQPFVTQASNRAPQFHEQLLGPFDRNRWIDFPIGVVDREGDMFDVQAPTYTGSVSNNRLRTQIPTTGVIPLPLLATELSNTVISINPPQFSESHRLTLGAASGEGWVMYSSLPVHTRFAPNAPTAGDSPQLLVVRYDSREHWQYWGVRHNESTATWISFDPRPSDLLVASATFDSSNRTVQALLTPGTVHGVHAGYVAPDLPSVPGNISFAIDGGSIVVIGDHFTLRTARSSELTATLAVYENGAPFIFYDEPNYAIVNSADESYEYEMPLLFHDFNIDDHLEYWLDNQASVAGVRLQHQPWNTEMPYSLKWKKSEIDAWASSVALPASLPVTITVRDNHLATSQAVISIPVRDPSIIPTGPGNPTYRMAANRTWTQESEIINPGGYELIIEAWSLDDLGNPIAPPEGFTIATNDGRMQWTPSAELLVVEVQGQSVKLDEREFEVIVTIRVIDHPESPVFGQTMTLQVVDPAIMDPFIPQIDTSIATPTATAIGENFVFEPGLMPVDPNHQGLPVIWTLESGPQGMSIDQSTGRVHWVPDVSHLGRSVELTLRAASSQGAGSTLTFPLEIKQNNLSPIFTTTFPSRWTSGLAFQFDALAIDPERHQLRYHLLSAGSGLPEGLVVDTNSGRVTWPVPTTGNHEFLVRVSEKHNSQVFYQRKLRLEVSDSQVNLEPLIIGNPHGFQASAGSEFSYRFSIKDLDQPIGIPISFTVDTASGSTSATVDADGTFRWTPPIGSSGLHTFRLEVTDRSPHKEIPNNTRFFTFHVEAISNSAPVFLSANTVQAYVGLELVHQLDALDSDGDAVSFQLVGDRPPGMYIHPVTRQLRWQVAHDFALETQTVSVVAEDSRGAKTSQNITLSIISEDHTPPTLSFYMKDTDGNVIPPNSELLAGNYQNYVIWVEIRDNRGLRFPTQNGIQQNGSWYVRATNTAAVLVSGGVPRESYFSNEPPSNSPQHGLWSIHMTGTGLNQGLLEFYLEAYDQAGNTVSRSLRFYVNEPTLSGTAKILNITQDSPPITDRFEVRGNALELSEGVGQYDLKLTSLNDPDDFVYLARNQPALINNSIIGIVDGTMIPTGQYRLYLETRCGLNCIKAVDERIIEVQNTARLGNLEMSFSDLDVTLGGVPIPLVRTYNSALVGEVDLNDHGGFSSDFSPGWNLNLLRSSISVSHPRGVTTSLNEAFAQDTRILVLLPSGQVHRFTFAPVPLGGTFVPRLSPDPEFRSQLYLKDVNPDLRLIPNAARNDGTYVTANDNKESIPSNFGSAWILQTEEGLEYHFDLHSGKLTSIRSAAGARIDIEETPDGNVTVSTRNTGSGNEDDEVVDQQVTIIRQPTPGASLDNPRLRVVEIKDAVTETPFDHSLIYRYGVFDPVTGLVAEPNPSDPNSPPSNLAQVKKLDGTVASYGYQDTYLPRHLTTIYDNAHQAIFTATYFADVNEDSLITNIDSEDERFGRLQSTGNANGQPTNFAYDFFLGNGLKVRSTVVAGNTVEQVLNGRGDTVRTVTLVGDSVNPQEKRYIAIVTRYNLRGLPTARSKPFYITASDNRFTDEPPNPAENPLAWSELRQYDADGRPKTVTDAFGGVTTYTYDDGIGVHTVTDPSGITSLRRFDPKTGHLLETYSYRQQTVPAVKLNYITYEYDPWGNQTHQWLNPPDGPKILQTQSHYGETGFLQWTQQLGQPRQYYGYDGNGQQVLTWYSIPDAHQAGHFITRVTYQFNAFAGPGNPYPTTGFANHGLESAQFEIRGQTLFEETNRQQLITLLDSFDQANSNVVKTSESSWIKNSRDQVIETRSMALDSHGNPTWLVSRTTYDSNERVEYQTDSLPWNTPSTEITGTQFIYDDQGRVAETIRLRGLNIGVTVQSLGRGTSQFMATASPLSRTVTSYDDLGRVVSNTEYKKYGPLGESELQSSTTYNLKGQVTQTLRQEYGSDNLTLVTFITRTVYDDRDRVILQTDPYIIGNEVFATETIYDGLTDRAIGTVRRKNASVSINSTGNTSVETYGEELYRTLSYFNGQRLVKSVDSNGGETDYEYDVFGRTIATISPEVAVVGYATPQRHRTETEFDSRGRSIAQHSGIAHDLSGNGAHDRSNQQTTRYVYDDSDRVIRTIYGDGSYSEVRYDALGHKVAESKQVSAQVQLTWSEPQRSFVDSATGNLIPTRLMEYDRLGQLVGVELPAVMDPLAQNTTPVRPRYEYAYDASGRQTLIRDPYDRETRIAYNPQGRQISRTLPLGFGADGILGTLDDSAAEPFTEFFRYDNHGRLIIHTSFEGVTKQYVHHWISGRAQVEIYSFVPGASTANYAADFDSTVTYHDNYGRASLVSAQLNSVVLRNENATYDSQGRIQTVNSPEGTIRYEYDDLGRMQRKMWSSPGFNAQSSDDYENVTEYNYDVLGRLQSVVQVERGDEMLSPPETTDYAYNLMGNLSQTRYQNGIVHDYLYDILGRLDLLRHWHDQNDNGLLDPGEQRAEFDYTVRSDGKRTAVTEKIWNENGVPISNTNFSWSYDEADRLVREVATGGLGVDYQLDWVYDLVGNRTSQTKTVTGLFDEPDTVEQTEYEYDANDRLISELFSRTGSEISSSTSTYSYNKTQQVGKTTAAGSVTSTQTFKYNLQGRLASVINQSSDQTTLSRTDYSYDLAGNRVGSTQYQATTASPTTWTLQSTTIYLTDSQNPTGYSQVLEEVTYNATGQPTKKIIYTVGHDQISQTVYENWNPANSNFELQTSQFFGSDGHGSVRVLYEAAAAIARDAQNLAQIYHYDAYGNLLSNGGQALPTSIFPLQTSPTPLTAYLYSGESFDFRIGQQYLRARWYDPSNGRFNRLDPFAGNSSDPQSFHKYAYVHGDPVNGVDPTGMFGQTYYAYVRHAAAAIGAYARVAAQFGARAAESAYNLLKKFAIESLKPTGFKFLFGSGPFAARFSSTVVTFMGRFVFNSTINLLTLNVLQENLWPVIGSLKLLQQQASNFNGRLVGLPGNLVASYSSKSADVIQDMLAERDEDIFLSAATTGQIGVIGSSILAARAFITFSTGVATNIAMIEESVPIVYSMLPPNAKAKVDASLGVKGGIREFEIDYSNPSVAWDAYNGHLRPHQEIDIFRKFLVGVDQSNDVEALENLILLARRLQQKYGIVKVNGAVVRI